MTLKENRTSQYEKNIYFDNHPEKNKKKCLAEMNELCNNDDSKKMPMDF